MKALITGAGGQLGQALQRSAPAGAEVVALSHQQLDIASRDQVDTAIGAARPDIVFNAAAYTAVDAAERAAEQAQLVNATAVGHLATAARRQGSRFVQVSTDYVFEGSSTRPYLPSDPTSPINVYGRSKLAGEQAAGSEALVVRTSWLYAAAGQNFVRTMLRLMASRDEVGVVADQVGTPTWVDGLAQALWQLALSGASGIHHVTDSGVASWYDFAVAIQEEALTLGLLPRAVPVRPIATAAYPTPARRPAFSVLDKSATWQALGGPAPHWRVQLRYMLMQSKSLA